MNLYNPDEYANLNVSTEIKELFKYISRFKPQAIDLDSKLKVFLPEYSPAVGEVDAFIKMPRGDHNLETLGLNMLVNSFILSERIIIYISLLFLY